MGDLIITDFLLRKKYKALSLLKQLDLLAHRDGVNLRVKPRSIASSINNDLETTTDKVEGLYNDFINTINIEAVPFIPNDETLDEYFNKILKYISFKPSKKVDNTIYSPFIFTRWLFEIYNINGFEMESKPNLTSEYELLFTNKNIDIIKDIEMGLNLYKKGATNRNTFKMNFLEALMGLFLYLFTEQFKVESSYCLLGNILLDNGDMESAKYYFKTATIIEEEYFTGFMGIGDAFRFLNDFEDAISYYNKALQILNKYQSSEKIPYYIENYNDQINLYTDCYYSLSLCYAKLNNFSLAVSYIDKAISLNDKSYKGFKIDRFGSLNSVKTFINNLYSEFEKSKAPEYYDFTKSKTLDPKIKEILISLYEKNYLSTSNKHWHNLSAKSKYVLKNIFFFEAIFNEVETQDYSFITSQYFKVIEIELYDRLLMKIEMWLKTNSKNILNLRSDIFSNCKFKKVTLASYRYIFSEKAIQSFINEYYSDKLSFFTNEFLQIIDELLFIRNGSAHRSLTSKEKHDKIKFIITENRIFESLCEL